MEAISPSRARLVVERIAVFLGPAITTERTEGRLKFFVVRCEDDWWSTNDFTPNERQTMLAYGRNHATLLFLESCLWKAADLPYNGMVERNDDFRIYRSPMYYCLLLAGDNYDSLSRLRQGSHAERYGPQGQGERGTCIECSNTTNVYLFPGTGNSFCRVCYEVFNESYNKVSRLSDDDLARVFVNRYLGMMVESELVCEPVVRNNLLAILPHGA